jgi:hypothetical protein
MSTNEAIAFVIFLVLTVAFFLWLAYLAIRGAPPLRTAGL